MTDIVKVKIYNKPTVDLKAIYNYAKCPQATEEIKKLVLDCLNEVNFVYKVCYRELDLSDLVLDSKALKKNLEGCNRLILFAATVGFDIDRQIVKNSRLNPTKALFLQAIGTERVESLCDLFEEDIKKEKGVQLSKRFSPGYADLPLEMQKYVFKVLDCYNKIGLTLNDSLLMSPSKSVTAIIGIKG